MAKTEIKPLSRKLDTAQIPLLKARFLKAVPMPLDDDGNDKYTFVQHLSIFMWGRAMGEVAEGKKKLDAESGEEIIIEE